MADTGELEQTINDYLVAIGNLFSDTFSTAYEFLTNPLQLFENSEAIDALPVPAPTFFTACFLLFLLSMSIGSRIGLKQFDGKLSKSKISSEPAANNLTELLVKIDLALAKLGNLFVDVKLPSLILIAGVFYTIPVSFTLIMENLSPFFHIKAPSGHLHTLNVYFTGCVALVYSAFVLLLPPHVARFHDDESFGIRLFLIHFMLTLFPIILIGRYSFSYFASLSYITDTHWAYALLFWTTCATIWITMVSLLFRWYKPVWNPFLESQGFPKK